MTEEKEKENAPPPRKLIYSDHFNAERIDFDIPPKHTTLIVRGGYELSQALRQGWVPRTSWLEVQTVTLEAEHKRYESGATVAEVLAPVRMFLLTRDGESELSELAKKLEEASVKASEERVTHYQEKGKLKNENEKELSAAREAARLTIESMQTNYNKLEKDLASVQKAIGSTRYNEIVSKTKAEADDANAPF